MKPYSKHLRAVALPMAMAALCSLTPIAAQAGVHTWSGAGANANFSTPQNWASGGVPALRENAVVLVFPPGAVAKSPIQNIADLGIDQMVIQADGYTFGATLGSSYFLRGGFAVDIENNSSSATVFNPTAAVVLNAADINLHGVNGSVTFNGNISGKGGLRIDGPTVEFGGPIANTYSGVTTVFDGILKLNKSVGAIAVPGALKIGHVLSNSPFPLEDVILLNDQQISQAAAVTVNGTGRLLLDGHIASIASLDMTGGSVSTGVGKLTLFGNVHSSALMPDLAAISGVLSLGAQSRVFDVDAGAQLRVDATIIGSAGVGFTKQGEGRLEVTGGNTYSGPTTVEAGLLVVSGPNVALGTDTVGTVVANGAQLLLSWAAIANEPLQLNGDPADNSQSVFTSYGTSSWAGPVSLLAAKTNTVSVQTVDMTFSGAITGPGSLRFVGELVNGNYTRTLLTGSGANTYGGATWVERGRLQLKKPAGVNAIPGALVVGHGAVGSVVPDASVEWVASNQVSDSTTAYLLPSGRLDLLTFNESLKGLDMDGGFVSSTSGLLTLLGDVTSHGNGNDSHFANISGHLSLGNQTRVFDCLSQSSLFIAATVSGTATAGLTKKGLGALALAGANTYPGLTTIVEGGIAAHSDLAFGSTSAGTVVNFDAGITLYGAHVGNEALELNGSGVYGSFIGVSDTSWAGPITLNGGKEQSFYPRQGNMELSGPISGSGKFRLVTEKGKLMMTGSTPNTYSGGTLIYSGELVLSKNPGVTSVPGALSIGLNSLPSFPTSVILSNLNQIADSSAVTLFPNSTLKLNNHTETIGSIEGVGEVITDFATLITGGNDFTTTFSGLISGAGFVPLIKQGTGTMTLTGTNAVAGRTLVHKGKYIVHGRSVGPVWVDGSATLGGYGSVGDVASTNGVVSPGAGAGALTTEDFALDANSTFRVELNGSVPGVSYDQVNARGKVALGNATLLPTLGFVPTGSDRFTVIQNDGDDSIQGTFAGLPEGKEFQIDGVKFRISYTGGTGNDVVLSLVNTAPGLTSITGTPFVNEGGTVNINGVINDPDAGDSFSFAVNWGDGSPLQTFQLPAGTFSFHIDHLYLDDKSGASPSDNFEISYTLSDNSGPGAFGKLNVVVSNVPPSLELGSDLGIASSTPIHLNGSFSDPGNDTWSATVSYGDGSPTQPLPLGLGKTFVLDHTFPSDGSYTVKVTITDDDGGSVEDTARVDVGLKLTLVANGADLVRVSWPSLFKGYVLEASGTVAPIVEWAPVAGAAAEINGEWVQTIESSAASGFFRLVKP